MPQFQGSLGPFPDFVKKGRPDARSAPSNLDPWMQSNNHATPVTSKEWRRIWRDLLPYLVIVTGFAAYIVWAWWPK